MTGTPATGKKSVAPLLADILGLKAVELNAVAGYRPDVDTQSLRRAVLKLLPGALIYGHLLPDVLRSRELDFVAVLRCEPSVLKRRLCARGYPGDKVVENVEAELIGVVSDASVRSFGPTTVHEYDTTRAKPQAVARRIARDYLSRRVHAGSWTDWTLRYDSSTKLRSLLSVPRTEPAPT